MQFCYHTGPEAAPEQRDALPPQVMHEQCSNGAHSELHTSTYIYPCTFLQVFFKTYLYCFELAGKKRILPCTKTLRAHFAGIEWEKPAITETCHVSLSIFNQFYQVKIQFWGSLF